MKKINVEDAVGLPLCHDITAMRDGKVATVNVSKGDTVTHGQALMSYAG